MKNSKIIHSPGLPVLIKQVLFTDNPAESNNKIAAVMIKLKVWEIMLKVKRDVPLLSSNLVIFKFYTHIIIT